MARPLSLIKTMFQIPSRTMPRSSTRMLNIPVLADEERGERCETCRFWESMSGECHRHAPTVPAESLGEQQVSSNHAGVWPQTLPTAWCGDWASEGEHTPSLPETVATSPVAVHLLISRVAPFFNCETIDVARLIEPILSQLQPDVRRVIIRVHGLDGQPLQGLKVVCRELKMSQAHVRTLLSAGEERIEKALRLLSQNGTR